MVDPAISMRNVSVTFGGRAILRNVSFDVPRGHTLAVMGLSGVGKSGVWSVGGAPTRARSI